MQGGMLGQCVKVQCVSEVCVGVRTCVVVCGIKKNCSVLQCVAVTVTTSVGVCGRENGGLRVSGVSQERECAWCEWECEREGVCVNGVCYSRESVCSVCRSVKCGVSV